MSKFFSICVFTLLILHSASDTARSQARIVGGTDAPPGAYPWMAALVKKNESIFQGQFCGGMLIAPQWVLTAAHCVEGENKNTFDVWIGLHNLNSTAGAVKRKVVAVYRHPNYRGDANDNLFYDAALILLDYPVTEIAPVGLASLPSHNDLGSVVKAIGWGKVHPVFNSFPTILQEADLEIVDIADAQADYQNSLGPYHLAAAVPGNGKDTCSGDSGGPLFRIISGNHILVGITSFGEGCAVAGVEGIYTNVLFLRAWIDGWLRLTTQPPSLSLTHRSRTIRHKDRTPSFRQGTFFGTVPARRSVKTKTYRMRNNGAGLLIAHGARISNRRFKFLRQGPQDVTFPGGKPKVLIKFTPRRRGTVNAKVRIRSNDPTNPLFWFRIRGKGR